MSTTLPSLHSLDAHLLAPGTFTDSRGLRHIKDTVYVPE
jgi:hypothetical protein